MTGEFKVGVGLHQVCPEPFLFTVVMDRLRDESMDLPMQSSTCSLEPLLSRYASGERRKVSKSKARIHVDERETCKEYRQ